ncbi:MAG TPA: efflux transporter outer membrane subunit, partial [Oleiagrimonas sp.]|nr:efflux transporter outer membrane subunit [Oleiagrimonas sp.]
VGPDFSRPSAPAVKRYMRTPLMATVSTPGVAGGAAQRVVKGADVDPAWWHLFHSSGLDALEKQALAHNPTLAAARDTLRAAQQQTLAGRGAYVPSISAGVSGTRTQDPSAALAPVPSNNAYLYNLFTPQLSIAYAPDVFGLARRQVESLAAQEQAARFAAIAAYNTLTTQVAVTAIEAASLDAQIKAAQKMVGINRRVLKMARYRLKAGYASGMDVAAQQAQLAQAQAALPPLRKQLAAARNRLAVLCGQWPGQWSTVTLALSELKLPRQLPLSLPSQLVAQRPDVRQAQANWHAASAAVGVADIERLPHIQLTANAGSTALAIADVFTSGTGFWNLAAGITAPLFDGGTLRHQAHAARAELAAAAAQYRGTVLQAFEDVADTLTAIDQDARALQLAEQADKASRTTLAAVRRRFRDGYASGLDLAQAEQGREQARMALIQARESRYTDTAALFQALGGGWQHRHSLAQP